MYFSLNFYGILFRANPYIIYCLREPHGKTWEVELGAEQYRPMWYEPKYKR
jgi:hypothetical protein